ncbi:hypothetical protein [Dyadobacter pollutisoli]|jgi:hypothetical protein|uniref:Uncharacterized protein n=1 Tax=Dyadobacter pollutisoli TaxID=2910158 RepID=A0A9E8N697_9BACT|nr:hypothetical protein [Dyadobacter pollutisoli]WAC10615.1 hypothetical protein ON006_23070 [Dyadobacter pollutisoli]
MSMGRGEQVTKKVGFKAAKDWLRRFLERGFDWIALFIIALIILLSLVFF